MNVIMYLIDVIVSNGFVLFIFFKINQLKFSFKALLLALFMRIPLSALMASLDSLMGSHFFQYLDYLLYGLILSFWYLKSLPKTLIIFYGLFPVTLWNLFYRYFLYFGFPIFNQTREGTEKFFIPFLINLCTILLIFAFLRWLKYDFIALKNNIMTHKDNKILYLSNCIMLSYSIVMETLTYIEYEQGIRTIHYREFVLVSYLILFMGVIKQLDTIVKERLQQSLNFQQHLQLKNMKNYSNHIEELYQTVRGFRHDYVNLLTTLHLSIEEGNIKKIREVYNSVLKDSNKRLNTQNYDIGRLVAVKDPAIKSLLATKLIQASEQGISVGIEIPESIKQEGMDLVDFITVISIFCDNALEATVESHEPKITIAFVLTSKSQIFIIENSTKKESIDISSIYSLGTTSKGKNRGMGLYNVIKIMERYPNISLKTTSEHYTFCQVLEVYLEDQKG